MTNLLCLTMGIAFVIVVGYLGWKEYTDKTTRYRRSEHLENIIKFIIFLLLVVHPVYLLVMFLGWFHGLLLSLAWIIVLRVIMD